MATVYEPITKCQKCNGPVWDNRKDKKSPKHPDFKCKDKECGEAFWLGEPKVGKPTKSTFVPKDVVDLPTLYDECLTVAIAQLARQASKHEKLGVPAWTDIIAAAATLFIQASRQGALYPEAKAPLDTKPKSLEESDEMPWEG